MGGMWKIEVSSIINYAHTLFLSMMHTLSHHILLCVDDAIAFAPPAVVWPKARSPRIVCLGGRMLFSPSWVGRL